MIKAYKCTVSEIWRDSFVLAYIACTSYPYIQSLPILSSKFKVALRMRTYEENGVEHEAIVIKWAVSSAS